MCLPACQKCEKRYLCVLLCLSMIFVLLYECYGMCMLRNSKGLLVNNHIPSIALVIDVCLTYVLKRKI